MGTIVLLDLMGGVAFGTLGPAVFCVHSVLNCGVSCRRRFLRESEGPRSPQNSGLRHCSRAARRLALMAASFVSEGVVALVPGLAIMLGTNVGTTLIVQVLSFNVSAAAQVIADSRPGHLSQRRAQPPEGRFSSLRRPGA